MSTILTILNNSWKKLITCTLSLNFYTCQLATSSWASHGHQKLHPFGCLPSPQWNDISIWAVSQIRNFLLPSTPITSPSPWICVECLFRICHLFSLHCRCLNPSEPRWFYDLWQWLPYSCLYCKCSLNAPPYLSNIQRWHPTFKTLYVVMFPL